MAITEALDANGKVVSLGCYLAAPGAPGGHYVGQVVRIVSIPAKKAPLVVLAALEGDFWVDPAKFIVTDFSPKFGGMRDFGGATPRPDGDDQDPLERIASALERIADVLEERNA